MNKKGFTLIELLAVIIILAVIALILIPGINKIVDNAKMATFKESVNNIISSGENYISKYIVEHPGDELKYPITFICNGDACTNGNNESLTFEGKVPKEGNLILRGEQDIYAEYISDGKYCAAGTKGNLQVLKNCDDIDVTAPTVSVEADFWDLTITITDNKSGAGDYCLTLTNDVTTCEWISNSEEVVNHHVDIEQDTTYYVFAKDKKGNISNPVETLVKPKIPYKEEILNGSWPVVKGDLIPVTIEANGTVHKADIYKEWYKYDSKTWANAVILINKNVTYEDNQVIPESNIESYFVWIPKYSYKLFDMGNYDMIGYDANGNWITYTTNSAHPIDIQFGTTNTTDTSTTCATPMTSGTSGNCAVNKYMTHPSFISFNVNGFWVGKFATASDADVSVGGGTRGDSVPIRIKPGKMFVYYGTMDNFFLYPYNYNRTLDSHLMKNTEWGAIAYLSYSKYGVNKEIRYNNSYGTGCAATNPNDAINNSVACPNAWNSATGYLASTTGNISGVYDMSGIAKFVAAYFDGATGSTFTANTRGYNAKYFDVYDKNWTSSQYVKYRILGDATGELGALRSMNGSYTACGFNYDISDMVGGYRIIARGSGGYVAAESRGIFANSGGGNESANSASTSYFTVLSPQ